MAGRAEKEEERRVSGRRGCCEDKVCSFFLKKGRSTRRRGENAMGCHSGAIARWCSRRGSQHAGGAPGCGLPGTLQSSVIHYACRETYKLFCDGPGFARPARKVPPLETVLDWVAFRRPQVLGSKAKLINMVCAPSLVPGGWRVGAELRAGSAAAWRRSTCMCTTARSNACGGARCWMSVASYPNISSRSKRTCFSLVSLSTARHS